MSLNESDSASASQANSFRPFTTQPNFGKCSVGKIPCITITDNMDWGHHVSEIFYKATKKDAYKTLVRPKLEYAAPIWSPHSKLQINQIEKVQRTADRWTCRRCRNTSSVGEMLDELEWPSLEAGKNQSSLLLFQKIHCGAVSIENFRQIYDPCS